MIAPSFSGKPAAPTSMFLSAMLWAALAAYALYIGVSLGQQWDLRIFHAAPVVLSTGANPYDLSDASLGYPPNLAFLYPPLSLYVLEPLSFLPYRAAHLIWFVLKIAALYALVRIWHVHFERLSPMWPTVLFLAFAFNATILRDLKAGNLSIFEQLGIWFAFSLLLRDRAYSAGLILAAVAQFKLVPIVLLGLWLFIGPRPRWKPFALSLGVFVALLSLNFLLQPDMTRQFIDLLMSPSHPNLDERGDINPSSLAFARDIVDMIGRMGVPIGKSAANMAYAACVALLALGALWLVWKRPAAIERDPRWLIYLGCVLYTLTMPRMKAYSHIIMLIPSLYVVREIMVGKLQQASLFPLIAVIMLPHIQLSNTGGLDWLPAYVPLLATWCVLYYLVRLRLDEFWPATAQRAVPMEEPSQRV